MCHSPRDGSDQGGEEDRVQDGYGARQREAPEVGWVLPTESTSLLAPSCSWDPAEVHSQPHLAPWPVSDARQMHAKCLSDACQSVMAQSTKTCALDSDMSKW